ncbi:MAG: hypothetical protein MUO34_11550 [Ignavibacteriaceae bacterium]|nr:hypothetical protein [Ignavibacteriaceae bacterium]
MKIKVPLLLLSLLFLFSCGEKKTVGELETQMNSIAESYVKLVLKIGQYDPDFVDAYFGPEEWKPKEEIAESESTVVEDLNNEVDRLLNELEQLAQYKADKLLTLRYRYLYKQLLAAKTRIMMLKGIQFPFNQETNALYDVEVPSYTNEYFQNIIDELDKILPGKGTVDDRLLKFKNDFVIPKEKINAVFQAAIEECRKRTLQQIKLPDNENFTVEYVTNKPWGAYNWYKGNSFSLIQVNVDLPVYIDRAIDLAAHEGYPGHHVYNALLENKLARKKDWVEFTVYALFSPQSLIAEGTANYGIEVAFPGNSRIEFEKEILFPLAGLNPDNTELYYKVLGLQNKLNYTSTEAARNYLDGKWMKDETVAWLQCYGLRSEENAERNITFFDKYRSYIINYSYGLDLVRSYIERNGGTADSPVKRWRLFEDLLSKPYTPASLQ